MTVDKYSEMVSPLVEFYIPENIVREIWLEKPVITKEDSYSDKLAQLLSFLRAEVKWGERILSAETDFKQN